MVEPETEYLMERAKEEALAAIKADHPSAAAAHQQLSVLYSTRAVIELGAVTPIGPRPNTPDAI